MIAAEKWYEHQVNYQKYGLDMKPKTKASPKTQPAKKVNKAASAMRAKDRARLMTLILFAGILCTCLIIITAYSAKIQYDINRVMAQCDVIEGEIENLNVAVKSGASIETIEEKAVNELGMVYPTFQEVSYLQAGKGAEMKDFAMTLKEIAYSK